MLMESNSLQYCHDHNKMHSYALQKRLFGIHISIKHYTIKDDSDFNHSLFESQAIEALIHSNAYWPVNDCTSLKMIQRQGS